MRPTASTVVRYVLAVVAFVGLAVDAFVHFDLASTYDLNTTAHLSQGDLFRIEGVLAILAAVVVLARPRRWSAALAALIAGSALAVLLVYRYAMIGRIGPVPSMYEPIWFPEKTLSGYAEAIAFIAATGLAILPSATIPAGRGDVSANPGPARRPMPL